MSDADTKSWTEQLMLLRGMTARTGMLQSVQVHQLEIWPRVALPHSTKSVASFSFERKRVEFKMTFAGRAPKQLRARMNGLAESVQEMLGPEYTVVIKDGSKKLFEKKGTPLPKKLNPSEAPPDA